MSDSLFSKTLSTGQPIRPYMVSGVLEKDYIGSRSTSEMDSCLKEALHLAAEEFGGQHFREFDQFALLGMQGRFMMCPAESPLYADGHYYVMEKLALMPVYVVLTSERAQEITLGIRAFPLLLLQNGKLVYDSYTVPHAPAPREYGFEHGGQWVNVRPEKPEQETVRLSLVPGDNVLIALTGKINRGTGISFSMSLEAQEAPLSASIPLNMDAHIRREIAESERETYLRDDCIRPGEKPALHIGRAPLSFCEISLQLENPVGRITVPEIHSAEPSEADIEASSDKSAGVWTEIELPDPPVYGKHTLHIAWSLPDGTMLTERSLCFRTVDLLQPLPGFDHYENRRMAALARLAEVSNPLALYRLGRYEEITSTLIDSQCSRIDRWADCADFDLLPLLWLVFEDRLTPHLPEEIHERIKKAALGFRYWVDEPNLSSMFYCSENHRIGFHVSEYLAGLLYPEDIFTNTRQNGMYHSLKGRMHLMEWLSQRCRAGFDEPHSDTYLPITLSALLVLREVLPRDEYPLRNMVNILLDYLSFIFAVSDFDGVMATPRGRSYNETLRSALFSHANGVFWQLFGDAPVNVEELHPELAFSPYIPPKGIASLAENFEPADFFFREGILHFDKHNADFTIRRTPEYMIGGVRDHNVGLCDMHFISAMIALRGDISIFFSAPNNVAEGSGLRPDYWAGQAFLPRVLAHGRALAVIWHGVNDNNIWMTHCHFNKNHFDEVVVKDGWTFGRSREGYVGIWSSVPHTFRNEGPYAGRELVCPGNEAVWIAECGSRREDGSFEAFMEKLLQAEVGFIPGSSDNPENPAFHFTSPGSGCFDFGLRDGFTVDGKEVPIPEYTVLCPYVKSRYGSGRFDYTVPGFTVTHWSYAMNE